MSVRQPYPVSSSVGPINFTDLDDVPASYSGQSLKVVRVNVGETALEFAAGGGGAPGGSDTQVQFNDSSAFGGDSGLTFNKAAGGGFQVQAKNGASDSQGGSIELYCGAGTGTGNGGEFFFESGSGGATGSGGIISLVSGEGVNGGDIELSPGGSTGGGVDGKILINGKTNMDGTDCIADGTYTVGLGLTINGTITTKNGLITAIQEAS